MSKITIVFLILTSNTFAQISVDSLLTNLNASYNKIGTRKYLQENFIQFQSTDKREMYDVYFDSTNQLSEFIGLSIVHYSYDTKNRVTLIEGFNSKGERRYWDFPVKTIFTYFEDTTIVQLDSILSRLNFGTNNRFNVVLEEEFNINEKYNMDRYKVYTKDTLIQIKFAIWKRNKTISHDRDYISYTLKQFDSVYRNEIIAERFFDSTLNLINAKMIYDKPYAYVEIHLKDGKKNLINYFNKNGELVFFEDKSIYDGPVAISAPVEFRKRRFFRFRKD